MKDVSVINLIALAYSLLLALVIFIFFREYTVWAVLGSATALFNHSQTINLTKNKLDTRKLVNHLVLRFVMYTIVITFAYFDQRANGTDELTRVYIVLLLGLLSIKIGVFIYATPFFKAHRLKDDEYVELKEYDDDDK
jgi:ABC-type phosphate transport system permease subunit